MEIARERLPGARIEIGEMENLPFEDRTYDLDTSFNAFQFAENLSASDGPEGPRRRKVDPVFRHIRRAGKRAGAWSSRTRRAATAAC